MLKRSDTALLKRSNRALVSLLGKGKALLNRHRRFPVPLQTAHPL